MATSNEKVARLADHLPDLVGGLGLGPVMAGTVSLAMPFVSGEVGKLVAMPTDQLDELLDQLAGFVAGLRTDTIEGGDA